MTDEELEKRAERYARNSLSTLADTVIQDNVKQAYIKGAKENAPVWHWLTRNPDDLPKVGSTVITYWCSNVGKGIAVFDYGKLDYCNKDGSYRCDEEWKENYVGFIEQVGYVRLPLDNICHPIKAWQYLPKIPEED